jgi:hypothetical protein
MELPKMKEITKQIFNFQKSAFNTVYQTITMVSDQTEKFGTTFIQQNPVLPQQMKDAASNWLAMCKKARDDYRKAIDDTFANMEKYFSGGDKGN